MTTIARPTSRQDSHWYKKDGTPCYELPKKDGTGMKVPTLADAKKLDLLPSVTTILKTLNKPELINWIVEQAVLAVLTSPRKPGEPDDQFVHRILHVEEVQNQERDAAAQRGTDLHNALQDYFEGKPVAPDLKDWITPAATKLAEYGATVCCERPIAGVGYAGRIDYICSPKDKHFWVWDFKTTKKLPERGAWKEHVIQLAAYSRAYFDLLSTAMDIPGGQIRCANIYISTVDPGKFVVWEHEPWFDAFRAFEHLLEVWYWLNNWQRK